MKHPPAKRKKKKKNGDILHSQENSTFFREIRPFPALCQWARGNERVISLGGLSQVEFCVKGPLSQIPDGLFGHSLCFREGFLLVALSGNSPYQR